ncbi:hypothetical protein PILCRDRAFT_750254 [Piloderma croceum F 1598]|uniref:Uncharacterized protein n=1 Tax=Piloderma croceum (strain F 1598) TaxID=765440 RepID=A0A0C3AD55_PILCF|nr:hypothetical protein PILCRDRAFT_750254 [Piloderma croceum F 1598]
MQVKKKWTRCELIFVLLPLSYDPVKQAECSSAQVRSPAITFPNYLAPSLLFPLQHPPILTRQPQYTILSLTPKPDLLAMHAIKQNTPAFGNAFALLLVWANQRGYDEGERPCIEGTGGWFCYYHIVGCWGGGKKGKWRML